MSLHIPDKLKNIFTDTIWSIAGLALMNVAAQFVVFPCWNRVLGSDAYGNIVYSLAVMNVLAISFGSGINYTRMRRSAEEVTENRPYNLLMSAGMVFSLLILAILKAVGLLNMNAIEFVLFCILTAMTMWRYYADVEYRLHINYKGYFFYYLIIGLGYLLGTWLFKKTVLWPLALLPGEIAGLLLVIFSGSIFRKDTSENQNNYLEIMRLSALLIGTNVLSHLIFNGDRIILQLFAGSTAVSLYYIASLFGKTMTLITTPLNGVLVGHLAKYEGKLTKIMMDQVTIVSIGVTILATAVCCLVSVIILPFLYPSDFLEVKQYLILANTAQVIYFVGNVLTASILLRFTHARNQIIINSVHGVLFAAVCIPVASRFGIGGFCWGVLVVNLSRLLLCVLLGYMGTKNDYT